MKDSNIEKVKTGGTEILMYEEDYRGWRNFKSENIEFIKEVVEIGDDVTVIGGGFGFTTIAAFQECQNMGSITIYEGDSERLNILKRTISANQARQATAVNESYVKTDQLHPKKLSEVDVLEIDCEGDELNIFRNWDIEPRYIVVETHPNKGCSTDDVIQTLKKQGYEVRGKKDDDLDGHIILLENI